MSPAEKNLELARIGMFGLGVMGENLALNIARRGFPVVIYDRKPEKVAQVDARAAGQQVTGAKSLEEFVNSLERPRQIVLLIKAGDPVDWSINQLKPYLQEGDIIIDGGNSHFLDTARREQELKALGLNLIGSGISGGEYGALWGPSLMPGGERAAYEQVRPVWEAIAARVDGEACVTYIGPGGAGHFVKMVHNGIEYGDMQLIAEAYDLMRRLLGLEAAAMSEVFEEWNRGPLESYLIEITAKILRVKDPETAQPLVNLVLDKAGQKGTGKWTSAAALELGVAIPTINAAVDARTMSALKDERVAASQQIKGPPPASFAKEERTDFINAVRDALYVAKICSYAQGMNLIRAGSAQWQWNINLGETARIWKGGCIIRAKFLGKIKTAYERQPELPNLLLDAGFNEEMESVQDNWRRVLRIALGNGVPVPAMAASLGYFDMYRTAQLPLNLTQAQRDYFGAHTYQRVDKPDAGDIHTEWDALLEHKVEEL